jgi:hypothetical protein
MNVDKGEIFWAACEGALLGFFIFFATLAIAHYLF